MTIAENTAQGGQAGWTTTEQAVLDPALKWEKLHPGIQASLMGTLYTCGVILFMMTKIFSCGNTL